MPVLSKEHVECMVKISKIAVGAVLMQAGLVYAAQAYGPVALEVRNVPVASVTTDRLSETSADLAAARQNGDDGKAEEILSRLFAGGGAKESATPVYSDKSAAADLGLPAASPVVPAAAPAVPASSEVGMAAEKADGAAAADDAAKKKKDDAAKLKGFYTGMLIMVLGLLMLAILL